MCGIAGLIGEVRQAAGERDAATVRAMLRPIRHRGPDSFEVRAWDHVCFGHVRLSIVDLSDAANQPMSYAEGRYWITFNGEIYDYLEIRSELARRGYTFRSSSDTEVVLAAYDCWGPACLEHFNGMWALAIYDRRERTCFLARDRFGVKPLYWAEHGGALLFASEMKSLLAVGVAPDPDLETIRWFLRDSGCDRGELTPFQAIRALPAGHCAIVQDGRRRVRRWWETLAGRVEVPRRFADRVRRFRELLEDAVRIRLRNDVDTALTLSGGADSSAIYVLAKDLERRQRVTSATSGQSKPVQVFSVSYPGEAIDESRFVETCVRAYDDKARYIYPTPQDFPRRLNDVIWHQESFVWNASVFAYHGIYRQIADAGIRVVVEGHGSDEMLAGYPYLVHSALHAFGAAGRWRDAWSAARCLSQTTNPALEQRSPAAWEIMATQIPRLRRALRALRRLRSRLGFAAQPPARRGRMQPETYLSEALRPPHEDRFRVPAEESLNRLQQDLYEAFHRRITPNAMRVFDRATMAASMESRAPFMDYRLVRYVFSLPIADIVGHGESKHILREAVKDLLPTPIRRRKAKLGFAVALKTWFEHPTVRDTLREIVHDPSFAQHGLVDQKAFTAAFEDCVRNGFSWQDTVRTWEVVSLSLWWRTFVAGGAPARRSAELAAVV